MRDSVRRRLARAARLVRYGRDHTHAEFTDRIHESPGEATAALAYSDWLREQGLDGHADVVAQNAEAEGDAGYPSGDIWPLERRHPVGATVAFVHPRWDGGNLAGYQLGLTRKTGDSRSLTWSSRVLGGGDMGALLRRLRAEGAELHGPFTHDVVGAADRAAEPDRYGAYRSPAGGVVVRGLYYPGGTMVPDLERFAAGGGPGPRRGKRRWRRRVRKALAGLLLAPGETEPYTADGLNGGE